MRARRVGLSWIAGAIASVVGGAAAADDDKPTLSGTWSASGLTETWSLAEWGEPCGPKPQSQGAAGGSVTISEVGGELSIAGAGRAFSTAECWEQMPGLARTSHSQSGGGRFWRTRCATPANDPRQAVVVTTLSATDDRITMVETGEYRFFIKGQECSANVSRSRSFTLVQRAGEKPPEPAPSASAAASAPAVASAPSPAVPHDCAELGPTGRLEVRPARKLMRPGESYTFDVSVFDVAGCPLAAKPRFFVLPGPLAEHAEVSSSGALTVDEAAPEGVLELVVELEGKGAHVHVEVASDAHYDALLASKGFNEHGEANEAAIVVIATATVGGKDSRAEDTAGARKRLFLAIVGGLAAVLGLVGLVLLRRGRKAHLAAQKRASAPPPPPNVALFDRPGKPQPMQCPSCGERFPPDAGFCPKDGAALLPDELTGDELGVEGPLDDEGVADDALAPSVASAPESPPAGPDKICPTCGQRYPAQAEFCGSDGTTLLPIN